MPRTNLRASLLLLAMLVACNGADDTGGPTDPVPQAPSNVTATPGPGYVTVEWTDESENETGFIIYRDDGTDVTNVRRQVERKIGEVGPSVERFIDSDVPLNTSTSYRVAAVNEHGESRGGAVPDPITLEPGIDLMVGTNDRRYDDGIGTVFIVYLVLPDAVLLDESLTFEGRLEGPDGWNDDQTFEFDIGPDHASRQRDGYEFVPESSIDAAGGPYEVTLTVGEDEYTANATLADASFKLGAPTDMTVTEADASRASVSWQQPPGTLSTAASLWRGDYEDFVAGYTTTTETSATFEDLDLDDGTYQFEIVPMNVDLTTYPVRTDPFGIAYDTVSFTVGNTVAEACDGPDDVVDVPDGALDAAIREAVGKASGDLTCSDMAQLEELEREDAGIASLEGLQYAVNLAEVRIAQNEVESLSPLADLSRLEVFEARDNPGLGGIAPLVDVPNLRVLAVSRTSVRDISPLADMDGVEDLALERLELDSGDIAVLDGHPALLDLELEGNKIDDLTAIGSLTTLKRLEVQENELVDLSPLANLSNLEVLDASGNPGVDLGPLADLTSLRELRSWGNEIADATPLTNLDNLEFLDLNANQLQDADFVDDLPSLERLIMGYNPIGDLSALHEATHLVELELERIGLTDIGFLEQFTNLELLDVAQNELTDISPLVANEGLGAGDRVRVMENFLDTSEGSDAMADIQTLVDLGVTVKYEPQNTSE